MSGNESRPNPLWWQDEGDWSDPIRYTLEGREFWPNVGCRYLSEESLSLGSYSEHADSWESMSTQAGVLEDWGAAR